MSHAIGIGEKLFFADVYGKTENAEDVFERYSNTHDLSEILNLREKKFFTEVYARTKDAAAVFDRYYKTGNISEIITPMAPLMSCDKNLLQFYTDVIGTLHNPASFYEEYFNNMNDPIKRSENIEKILKRDDESPSFDSKMTSPLVIGGSAAAALIVGFVWGRFNKKN